MPPRLCAQARKQSVWSIEMPRTWAFSPVNRACAAWYDGICAVHIGVKARGKKARTTFLPRRSLSVTGLPSWLGKVKSGASCPTRSSIGFSFKGFPQLYRRSHDPAATYADLTRSINPASTWAGTVRRSIPSAVPKFGKMRMSKIKTGYHPNFYT